MFKVYDLITGELIVTDCPLDIIEERIKFHQTEFCFKHRGKHYAVDCYYIIKNGDYYICKR